MRPNRMSPVLEDSLRRLERVMAINPVPNFGTGFSVADFETVLTDLSTILGAYNTSIAVTDRLGAQLREKEKQARDLRERLLTAIAFIYGKDSDEYVAAGGIRKSERKRPRPRTSSSATGSENVM